jgi:hypothetical protein
MWKKVIMLWGHMKISSKMLNAVAAVFLHAAKHNKTINNVRFAHWEKASLIAPLFPLL